MPPTPMTSSRTAKLRVISRSSPRASLPGATRNATPNPQRTTANAFTTPSGDSRIVERYPRALPGRSEVDPCSSSAAVVPKSGGVSDSVALDPSFPERAGVAPRDAISARRLGRLAAAVVGFTASLVAGGDWFWQAVRADGGGSSQWADFPGWQVSAMETGLAAVLAIVFFASVIGVQRGYRVCSGQKLQLRLTAILTMVPALSVGVGASLALPNAVAWASHRTAAASRFAAQQQALRAALRYHPIFPTTTAAVAPPQVARHMLSASDLGTGWFAAVDPEPSEGAPVRLPARWTAVQAARTVLQQAHRQGGTTWVFDRSVFEFYWRFRGADTAAAARGYLARQVAAFDRLNPSVVVRVGDQVIEIRIIRGQTTSTLEPSLQQIERLAVQQAR